MLNHLFDYVLYDLRIHLNLFQYGVEYILYILNLFGYCSLYIQYLKMFSNKISLKIIEILKKILLPSRNIQTFDESLAHDFVLSDEFLPKTTDEVLPIKSKNLILIALLFH